MTTATPSPRPFYRSLYFRVIVGIVAGIALASAVPFGGVALKPLGDIFIKLIRMMIAPIIFFTVVVGIANIGSTRKLGRVGLKALIYFEVVTTLALLIGLGVVLIVQPGRGMNIDPANARHRAPWRNTPAEAKHLGIVDFILNIIPDTFLGAFRKGEILQVLLLAILCGLALVTLDANRTLIHIAEALSRMFSESSRYIMEAAPIGAFGAMAFTIGKFGLATLLSFGKLLLCVYLTSFGFIFLVLGAICSRRHQLLSLSRVPPRRDRSSCWGRPRPNPRCRA